jgi:hypothetical protein
MFWRMATKNYTGFANRWSAKGLRFFKGPWNIAATVGLILSKTAQAQDQSALHSAKAIAVPMTSTAPASTGLLNDWLRDQSTSFDSWDIGGQLRGRFEYKSYFAAPNEHVVDFQRTGDPNNTYGLLRLRLHLGYTPCGWFQVYGEMQDSTAFNDDRRPSPDQDHYPLRQAWLGLGNPKEFPLVLKAGRQELIYGDQRLIGMVPWANFGRTFDAAKLRYGTTNFWVDAFTGQPVLPDLHEFDVSDDRDRLSGIYASTRTLLAFQESQLYFLARNTDEHPASEVNDKPIQYAPASPRDVYTIGGRVKSMPGTLGGWDYEAEADYQFGHFKPSDTSPSLEHQAYSLHVIGGYTWRKLAGAPRVGLEYNFASGDNDPNDGKHGTFDNLFPSNHGLYGIMDFFSLQNIQDLHLAFSLQLTKKLTLKLDSYAFWLADTHDYSYQLNGNPRKTGGYGAHPEYNSFVGSELDLIAAYNITQFASVQAGYGHFFASDYVTSSLAGHGGATDANYVFAQVYFNF